MDLPKHHDAMLRLVGWLSPAAADWCRGLDRFSIVYPPEPLVLVEGDDDGSPAPRCELDLSASRIPDRR